MCQAGYSFHDPVKNKNVYFSSEIYIADNNNDSEILGVYYALKAIYEKYNITNFRVFNDNVIACEMLRKDKEISKYMLKKHPVLQFVRDYFKENDIKIITEQVSRNDKRIKICDKYSKRFRKEKI